MTKLTNSTKIVSGSQRGTWEPKQAGRGIKSESGISRALMSTRSPSRSGRRATPGRRGLMVAAAGLLAVAVVAGYSIFGNFGAGALGPSQGVCPVTLPEEQFSPPAPFPAEPVGAPGGYFWYGTADLWTALPTSGRLLVTGGDKTFWWSPEFDYSDEPNPSIMVTANHRGGSAAAVTSLMPASHGWASGGQPFMLVGINVPEAGCWDLRAEYRGHVLELVVDVRDARR